MLLLGLQIPITWFFMVLMKKSVFLRYAYPLLLKAIMGFPLFSDKSFRLYYSAQSLTEYYIKGEN